MLITIVQRCSECHGKLERAGPEGIFIVCPMCRRATRSILSLAQARRQFVEEGLDPFQPLRRPRK